MPMPSRCDHCVYYHSPGSAAGYGECRRHPPYVQHLFEPSKVKFPVVSGDLWCGEGSAIPSPPTAVGSTPANAPAGNSHTARTTAPAAQVAQVRTRSP